MQFKNFVEKKFFVTILADGVVIYDVIFRFFAKKRQTFKCPYLLKSKPLNYL